MENPSCARLLSSLAAALCLLGALTWAQEAPPVNEAQAGGPAAFDHDPKAPADADIVRDFGLDRFYERFWGTLSVVDGNKLERSDGGKFDAAYVGRKVCLKFADATRYPGIKVAGYYTIKAVLDASTVELAETPDAAAQNEAGYIFGDNEAKFRKLLDAAFASGKVYKVSVPQGATFVLLGPFRINNNKGGVHFVSAGTDDPYVGGATFKFMKEEDPTRFISWFAWIRPTDVGPFDIVFENINLVARDSYGYNTEDNQALFRFAQNSGDRPAFTLKVTHCDFALEYKQHRAEARAYLQKRFGANVEELQRRYYLAARPKLIHTHALGGAERPFTWQLEYVNTWYVRLWAVSNTLYNKSKAGEFICIMRHVKAYGSVEHGRNGILPGSPLTPLVDIGPDADGDFTILTLAADNEVFIDFLSVQSQYSNYSRKRAGYGLHVNIEGLSKAGKGVPSDERRSFIFINQAKNRDGSAAKLGTMKAALARGDGIYDIVIDPDAAAVDHTIGRASGTGERLGGVTQYDYICSDNNGAIADNETSLEPTAVINRQSGHPNDYRGWVRYKYGDATQEQYCDNRDDWPLGGSAWIWIDNDKAGNSIKAGDKLYMETGEHWNSTVAVQKNGTTVHYFGRPFGQAPNPRHKYLQIDGKYYKFGVTAKFKRNLCGGQPVSFAERERTFVSKHHSGQQRGKHGAILELKGAKIAPGAYTGCSVWHMTVAKQIVLEPGVGTRVHIWGSAEAPRTAHFPLGAEVRPGHPANPASGKLLYSINVKTGNRKKYPNGKPFAKGETLYAYYLGTGADNRKPAARLQPGKIVLPKEWAVPGPVKNARLLTYTDPDASGGTHWVYGKGRGVQYLWEDVRFIDGKLGLLIRDGGAHKDGSVFKNCDLSYGGGMQLGGPITIDGGKYKVYGGRGEMTVRNNPTLLGAKRGFAILDPDGAGGKKGTNAKTGE